MGTELLPERELELDKSGPCAMKALELVPDSEFFLELDPPNPYGIGAVAPPPIEVAIGLFLEALWVEGSCEVEADGVVAL